MKVLAVDTATSSGGVALYDDATGALSECRAGLSKRQFSESIIEMIDFCLLNLSMTKEEIDCLAVTSGPGSFTGLRVGLSTVKGLAYASGKPVVTVSTLLAHAWLLPFHESYVCPVLDARKKEIYSSIYQWEGDDFKTVLKEGAYSIHEVLKGIRKHTIFIGDGLRVYKKEISDALGDKALFVPQNLNGSLPSALAVVAAKKAMKGEYTDIATFSPVYYRKSEAELKMG